MQKSMEDEGEKPQFVSIRQLLLSDAGRNFSKMRD